MKEVSGTAAAITVYLLAEHLVCRSLFVFSLKKNKNKKGKKTMKRRKQQTLTVVNFQSA